jgi:hypothetical protein
MDILEYIYEVIKIKSIPLGLDNVDEIFLFHILEGHTSAYQIYLILEKGIAYKNVHRRIKRLFEANMIEEVETKGGFKHGAKNYKLTTRGLVYLFAELVIPDIGNISLTYSENILFRTFLYPYFERNTIKSATYSLLRLLENYVVDCCQMTRYALDIMVTYLSPEDIDIKSSEFVDSPPINKLQFQLNWHIRSFLLKIPSMKDEIVDWRYLTNQTAENRFPSQDNIICTANDRIETFFLLSKDKKFMNALQEIERDFHEGYHKLVELKKA